MQHSVLPRSKSSAASLDLAQKRASAKARHVVASDGQIIYKSEAMHNLMTNVERLAASNARALILGESGTGKELIAQEIHKRSARSDKAFVAINCGALNEELLESELFGHEKGAFTNAYARKIGLAEAANEGTLFLDEIGDLSAAVQAKLLRFLEQGEFLRVGGNIPIKADVRLISATNRELAKDVVEKRFRQDLYYRINTVILHTPALRHRPEDIEPLVDHFLDQSSDYHHSLIEKPGRRMSDEALEVLCAYDWPGNVRELRNCCERLQILADAQTIQLKDLSELVLKTDHKVIVDYDPSVKLRELEKIYIEKALVHFESNKTRTSQALGITIKTLYNKLHEYDVFQKYSAQK